MPSSTDFEKIFEIFGVYFANRYWNNLYVLALDSWREEKFAKLDEAYKTVIERYSRAVCFRDERENRPNSNYARVMKDLHLDFKTYLENGATFLEFIDQVSKEILPRDYYRRMAMRDPKKETILREILSKTIMKFTLYVSQEETVNVINKDLREDKKSIAKIKNKFIEIFTQERNEFCGLLSAQAAGVNIKNRDEIPQVPKEAFDKLLSQSKKLMLEKDELIRERNKFAQMINDLKKILREKDKIINQLSNNGHLEEEREEPQEASPPARGRAKSRRHRQREKHREPSPEQERGENENNGENIGETREADDVATVSEFSVVGDEFDLPDEDEFKADE